jgi:hypothetical protein
VAVALAATLSLLLPVTSAALSDAQKCETTYLKATGKRLQCVLKAREKGIKKGVSPDFTKCEEKFAKIVDKIESKVGPSCPPRPWMGATARFVDNEDGTATDGATGLTWELKLGDGLDRDVDNTHPWGGSCSGGSGFCQPTADAVALCPTDKDGVPDPGCTLCPGIETCNVTDGQGGSDTIFTYVDSLNDANFGGHNDWRVPSKGDLTTILAEPAICTIGPPCISVEFHQGPTSFTAAAGYWASNTLDGVPVVASNVNFFNGVIVTAIKSAQQRIRAVRGP